MCQPSHPNGEAAVQLFFDETDVQLFAEQLLMLMMMFDSTREAGQRMFTVQ